MHTFSRRTVLAGSAAAIAAPAIGARAATSDVDVVVVGAGAAGIAAARRLAAAKVRFVIIEAADHVGGRCVTDTKTFGVPFDRGAQWVHRPQNNELVKLAEGSNLNIYPAPRAEKLRVPPRRARESEVEDFLTALVRSNRAIVEAGRGRTDTPAALALPRDLGEWKDTIEFVLGPYSSGKRLADVSAIDYARAPERGGDVFCREGYGTLLARLGAGLPVQLSQPVKRIAWGGPLSVDTGANTFRARAMIITASTGVLSSDAISFDPPLPANYREACSALSLGHLEQIALEVPGNPFGLDNDDLIYEKATGVRTAAVLANVSGTSLCMVSVGGPLAHDLAQEGEGAMTAFALESLDRMFGSGSRDKVKRVAAARWSVDPFVRGAFSAAAPGRADARRMLMAPLRDRVWFAGEASHETLWGTVNGAWESGNRAAEGALRLISNIKDDRREPEQPRRRRRRE